MNVDTSDGEQGIADRKAAGAFQHCLSCSARGAGMITKQVYREEHEHLVGSPGVHRHRVCQRPVRLSKKLGAHTRGDGCDARKHYQVVPFRGADPSKAYVLSPQLSTE